MTWRFDLLNHLIRTQGYRSYLEIGVENGDCFRAVTCEQKAGVDPVSPHATFKMTSDDFFAHLAPHIKYDLIFIDGLHVDEQVHRDILNSLQHLSPNGTIMMHDCNPPTAWHQRSYEEALQNGCRLWNGTVWKAYIKIRSLNPNVSMCVVDTDWGCGLIRHGTQNLLQLPGGESDITYTNLELNRTEWLNLISVDEFYLRFR